MWAGGPSVCTAKNGLLVAPAGRGGWTERWQPAVSRGARKGVALVMRGSPTVRLSRASAEAVGPAQGRPAATASKCGVGGGLATKFLAEPAQCG